MRITFAETLTELAAVDRRIVLLTADLGFEALDAFVSRHPDRFFNVGVAEQNMIGLATGLAEAGFIPFVYSIVPFAIFRAYEFIRNGPVQHRLPVRIVGVGAGFEYGSNGFSHYGLDDLAMTRVHDDLTVLAPADFQQTRSILLATWNRPEPIYYRLGKDERSSVPGLEGRFSWDAPELVREGSSVLLVTTSSISAEAAMVAQDLDTRGISTALVVTAQINPFPREAIATLLGRFRLVATIENHYPSGGLGSAVAEVMAEHGTGSRLIRLGASGEIDGRSGSTEFMHQMFGLSSAHMTEAIATAWAGMT
jgi:transketolase